MKLLCTGDYRIPIVGYLVTRNYRKHDGTSFVNIEPLRLWGEEDAGVGVVDDLEKGDEIIGIIPAMQPTFEVCRTVEGGQDKFVRWEVGENDGCIP
jgi:hypothetical protein